MAHVQDVATHILARCGSMSAMKLQKLCFYSYAYHLAWEEEQLFPERFQAWANGPVCYELYAQHRGLFTVLPGKIRGESGKLDAGEAESVDLVISGFGGYSANDLSTWTHNEYPWQAARKRANATGLDRCSEELWDSDIMEYFEALAANDAQEQG